MTLQEAVQVALKHNHDIRIAGYKVEEKQHTREVRKELVVTLRRAVNAQQLLKEIAIARQSLRATAYECPRNHPCVSGIGNAQITDHLS
jgi:outer membrane protein TolC